MDFDQITRLEFIASAINSLCGVVLRVCNNGTCWNDVMARGLIVYFDELDVFCELAPGHGHVSCIDATIRTCKIVQRLCVWK